MNPPRTRSPHHQQKFCVACVALPWWDAVPTTSLTLSCNKSGSLDSDSTRSEHQSSSLTRLSRYADDVHVYPRDSARIMKTKCDLWLSWISPSWNNEKDTPRQLQSERIFFFFFRHLMTLYCFGSAETDDSLNISAKLLDFLRNVQTVRIPRVSQPSPSAAALRQKAWKRLCCLLLFPCWAAEVLFTVQLL